MQKFQKGLSSTSSLVLIAIGMLSLFKNRQCFWHSNGKRVSLETVSSASDDY